MKRKIIIEERENNAIVTWEDGSESIYEDWGQALKGVGHDGK